MNYRKFTIENFRGIERLTLDFDKSPKSKIYTLVGLNESGKTTILEAINHFSANPESLEALDLQGYKIDDPHTLIPISKRANFNGEIKIVVDFEIEEDDWKLIENTLKKKHGLIVQRNSNLATVNQVIVFKDSRYIEERSGNQWEFPFDVKTKNAKNWRFLRDNEVDSLLEKLYKMFPSILYFPNFLFEFPDRIYLETPPPSEDPKKHRFYRMVAQDILDALDNDLNIDTHILNRATSGARHDQDNLKGLLLDMSRHVTEKVFGAWGRIFSREMSDKEVVIECGRDEEEEGAPLFLEFKIKDRDGYFLINQRSLGFRWFFVFLFLTEYRGFRKTSSQNVLFLFDEPASNLHSTAQRQLLESFSRLSKTCSIIYTTHSHHMINPDWLESTFVVINKGIHYDTDATDFTQEKTKIDAMRYREFAQKHPDQTTYFQPILDVLQWAPSKLEFVPDAIFVEGKNDFYSLNFLLFNAQQANELHFLPAMGSGKKEPLISLYVGWARNFIILLDADKEGEKQRDRYISIFGDWIRNRIFTLKDINRYWRGKAFEDLLGENDKKRLMKAAGFEANYNKKDFNKAVQELLAAKKRIELTKPGRQVAEKLHEGLVALMKID